MQVLRYLLAFVSVYLALLAPAEATVTRVGTGNGTNTCTTITHVVGDLLVVAAFRATTGTPSLGTGFQSIITKTGTTSSMRVGFKIATATNDSFGTWTNATATVCHVYRSGLYATGGSLYIGASASAAQTTNTINFPALTLTHGDTTSWVLGFVGANNLTNTIAANPPSGMTNESSETSATDQAAGHDTNGAVASWSSTNATTTGTPGGSVSATVELIENQPGTVPLSNLVQRFSYGYGISVLDPNTYDQYTYNFDPTLSGNGLVVAITYPHGATPTVSDPASDTCTSAGTAADAGVGNMVLQAFVCATVTTGTSQVTVSFGGSPQLQVKVWITQLFNITATVNGYVEAANVNSGGIVSPGSVTPTNNNSNGGNLVLAYMADAAQIGTTNPALIVPESNYALNDADISETGGSGVPNASQYYLQATSAATVPRFYLNTGGAETYNVIALALSVGTQGTPKPSGAGVAPHVDGIMFFATSTGPASWLLQIPAQGNCGVLSSFLNGSGVPTSASATDSDAVSWTKVTTSAGAQTPYYRATYSANTSRTIKVATSASGNLQLLYYDISNCATSSPLVASAGGTNATTNNTNSVNTQPSITPTATNQLTIANYINTSGPTPAVTAPSGAVYDAPYAYVAKVSATIATTTLALASTTWGTFIANGDVISGPGVTAGTSVTSGSGTTWTIQPSQTVTPAVTMLETGYDANTLNFGNAFAHFYNGGSTTAQNWTWSLANVPSSTGQGVALIFAGPPAGVGGAPMRSLMGVGQ